MNEYKEKLLCEKCSKPIGEVWTIDKQIVHQPYVNYRKWNEREVCHICRNDIEHQYKQQQHQRSRSEYIY